MPTASIRYDFLKDTSIGVLSASALLLTLILGFRITTQTRAIIGGVSGLLAISIVFCTGTLYFGTFKAEAEKLVGIEMGTWVRWFYLLELATFMVSLVIIFFAILLTL